MEDSNPTKKRKVLIVFDYMIADIEPNRRLSHSVTRINNRELQQIVSNHASDIDFIDFMKLYKDYTKEPYLLLVIIIRLSITI